MASSQPSPALAPILAKVVGSRLRGSRRKRQSLCLHLLAQGLDGELFETELCMPLFDPDAGIERHGRGSLWAIARSIGIDPYIEDSRELHGGLFAACPDGSIRPVTDDDIVGECLKFVA